MRCVHGGVKYHKLASLNLWLARAKFKDKFKALSLKFCRSGAARAEVKIRIKAAPNFGVRKQNLKRNSARKNPANQIMEQK